MRQKEICNKEAGFSVFTPRKHLSVQPAILPQMKIPWRLQPQSVWLIIASDDLKYFL